MAEITDHYHTLDLAETASAAEIKQAYRTFVRALHPDCNDGGTLAIEHFRAVQEAYEVLSNPVSRDAYDRMRLRLTGMLSSHDSAAGRSVAADSRSRGHVETEVRLSFERALQGGMADIRRPDGTMAEVPVPKGVRSGVKVRFRGRGLKRGDAAAGDLYVTFRVAPSERFRRESNDLHVTESITAIDAMLGTTRAITNAYGRRITISISPGTQPNERLRLRGQGVQTVTKAGDLYVEVLVTVPRSLTDEQRAALASCANSIGLM